MNDPIQTIIANRDQILIAEIGALLHDIGKCHPDFVRKQSKEKESRKFKHWEIDNFLAHNLITLTKDKKCEISINNKESNVYSIIKEHHNRNAKKKLIKLIKFCDRMNSAEDKGIVRKKQPMNNTVINSPFGYPKEKIDLECLENALCDLSDQLFDSFHKYISNSIDLTTFRHNVICSVKTAFAHALGETRIPSNDVTLWDHSHSTASLFKSAICKIALKEAFNEQELQWRILGFCWDGIGFINKGRKIADILERDRIIENIKKKLKKKFEDEIPIGNAIYEDSNGIYFTFPDLKDDFLKKVASKCAQKGLRIIRDNSNDEIFPFFILSEPSRALTILSDVLRLTSAKRNIPKMSPVLFFGCNLEGEMIESNPEVASADEKQDICPICQFRPKSVEFEICDTCKKRRKGRRDTWFSKRKHTIWIDEVGDKNNRIALLTLSFDLDRWLDGTMVQTTFSQTFEDWANSAKTEKYSQERSTEITGNRRAVYQLLEEFFINQKSNKGEASRILDTFFEDLRIGEKTLEKHINSIRERLRGYPFNKEILASYLFTQNPSPARLYRIWKETEEFFDLILEKIREKIYYYKWKRIEFGIDISQLILKNKASIEEKTSYMIKIRNLDPENFLVFHSSDGKFYTIESLGKFKFRNINGHNAVESALRTNSIYHLAEEDNPDENLLEGEQLVNITFSKREEYDPFIVITRSPIFLQVIIPASDSIKVLKSIIGLYNERFANVVGKLSLNMGLLVSKRKFPLYILLDAGERILFDKTFREPITMNIYWNIEKLRINEYYGFYPTRESANHDWYTLEDLHPISKGRAYAFYPGYFDFDFLTGTMCRYRIKYIGNKRADDNYRNLSHRPHYFYEISRIIDTWEILFNISSSQQSLLEEALKSKIMEWKTVNDSDKRMIFKAFAETVLKNAFEDKWNNLRKETQDSLINSATDGFLLDTIDLFKHTLKAKEVDKNESI